jgi:putative Ca2+/H+ antiporter (TMEM165/GDT1 family)
MNLSMFAGPEGARLGGYILIGIIVTLMIFFSISSTILFLIIGLSTLIPLVYFNAKKKLYDENNNLTKTAKGLLITTFISFILAIILYVYSSRV